MQVNHDIVVVESQFPDRTLQPTSMQNELLINIRQEWRDNCVLLAEQNIDRRSRVDLSEFGDRWRRNQGVPNTVDTDEKDAW